MPILLSLFVPSSIQLSHLLLHPLLFELRTLLPSRLFGTTSFFSRDSQLPDCRRAESTPIGTQEGLRGHFSARWLVKRLRSLQKAFSSSTFIDSKFCGVSPEPELRFLSCFFGLAIAPCLGSWLCVRF